MNSFHIITASARSKVIFLLSELLYFRPHLQKSSDYRKLFFNHSVYVFVFQTLAGLPDQDSYYDMVDCLEEQGIEAMAQRHLSRKGTDLDLVEQFNIYEVRTIIS